MVSVDGEGENLLLFSLTAQKTAGGRGEGEVSRLRFPGPYLRGSRFRRLPLQAFGGLGGGPGPKPLETGPRWASGWLPEHAHQGPPQARLTKAWTNGLLHRLICCAQSRQPTLKSSCCIETARCRA